MEIDFKNVLRKVSVADYKQKKGKIIIPEGVVAIGEKVFEFNEDLKEIILPQSLKEIHSRAFDCCANLVKINCKQDIKNSSKIINVFPKNLEYIGENAFRGCENLETFILPNCIKTIRSQAFLGCAKIKSFTYPKSLTHFGDGVFDQCTALKFVYLPVNIELTETIKNKFPSIWFVQNGKKTYSKRKVFSVLEK